MDCAVCSIFSGLFIGLIKGNCFLFFRYSLSMVYSAISPLSELTTSRVDTCCIACWIRGDWYHSPKIFPQVKDAALLSFSCLLFVVINAPGPEELYSKKRASSARNTFFPPALAVPSIGCQACCWICAPIQVSINTVCPIALGSAYLPSGNVVVGCQGLPNPILLSCTPSSALRAQSIKTRPNACSILVLGAVIKPIGNCLLGLARVTMFDL